MLHSTFVGESIMKKMERLHGPDTVRALMMLLGVVLHASMFYMTTPEKTGWPLTDFSGTHVFFDYLYYFIHSFRIPVFFVIAGYFSLMLFEKKGMDFFIKNRAKRIALPLLACVSILAPIMGYILLGYLQKYNSPLLANGIPQYEFYNAPIFFHLWFLYFLFLFYFGFLLYQNFKPKDFSLTPFIKKAGEIAVFPWGMLIGIVLTMPLYFIFPKGVIDTSVTLMPRIDILFYYVMFFTAGVFLYKGPKILAGLTKNWPWALSIGLLSFFVYSKGIFSGDTSLNFISGPVTTWCLVWGIVGFTFNYKRAPGPILTYLSEASYWIYLIHLPIIFALGGYMMTWQTSIFIKAGVLISFTTLFSLLTYHLWARSTLIGLVLNGKKKPFTLVSTVREKLTELLGGIVSRKAL